MWDVANLLITCKQESEGRITHVEVQDAGIQPISKVIAWIDRGHSFYALENYERVFYEGIKEDTLAGFPELVLNVNKGTKSLKAKAFPHGYRLVPKGIVISTEKGTSLKYLWFFEENPLAKGGLFLL